MNKSGESCDVHPGQDGHRYPSRAAASGFIVGADVCRKEPGIVRGFNITDEPTVYILAVDTSCTGFSIEFPGFGRGQKDRILH